jgi:NADP-dependent 3-hydroxy acid dehydrogenase YdfG
MTGIGCVIAFALARSGVSNLAIADINSDGLEQTAQALQEARPRIKILPIEMRQRDEKSVQSAIQTSVEKFSVINPCHQ